MPPKPLAEDLARKKAERDKKNKLDQAVAILERPGGFEQAVDLAKDPVGTAKKLGQVAKETFYDPVKRFSAAVDPTSSASPMERAAGIAEGALYAADFLTPGVPEGAIARNLQREAMERALDREVAGYAASGGGRKYRGRLILHGSSEPNLKLLEARPGSYALPETKTVYGVDLSEALADELDQMDPRAWARRIAEVSKYSRGEHRKLPPQNLSGASAKPYGAFYIGRVPEPDRIVRQSLSEDSVKIDPYRFDEYVISGKDVPVLAESRPEAYEDWYEFKVPADRRMQGPKIPKLTRDFEGEYFSVLDADESAVFDMLNRVPLRPLEKRRLAEMLQRRFEMNKIGPEDWE